MGGSSSVCSDTISHDMMCACVRKYVYVLVDNMESGMDNSTALTSPSMQADRGTLIVSVSVTVRAEVSQPVIV